MFICSERITDRALAKAINFSTNFLWRMRRRRLFIVPAWMMRPRRRNMNNKFVLGPTSWIWYRTHGGRERNLTLHLKLFTDEQNENKSLNEERYKKSFRSFWGISGVLWLQLLLGGASELTDYDMTHVRIADAICHSTTSIECCLKRLLNARGI